MINLVVSNNAGTTRDVVDPNKSILDLCSEYGLNVAAGGILVNGTTMSATQMSQSPAELGISGTLLLSQFKKLDNAAA